LKFSVSKLLSLCAIFRSDKYVVISKSNYNYDFSPPGMGEVA
jgi:non-ribosomal peptide synthetase component E (peptide arylation enzyme)